MVEVDLKHVSLARKMLTHSTLIQSTTTQMFFDVANW